MSMEEWARRESLVVTDEIFRRLTAMWTQKRIDPDLIDAVLSPEFRDVVSGRILGAIQDGWESPFGWSTQPPSAEPGVDRMDLLRRTFDSFIAEMCAKA